MMTPADAAELLAVAAAFDRRTVGDIEAHAWAKALHDLTAADCVEAIQMHYGRTTDWLVPAHIRAEVRRIRAARLERDPEPVPDADPDDVPAYLAALRAGRSRAGDGESPRPVGRLLNSAARRLSVPLT